MKFTEKVVIVTGASSGIGAATAIEFAKEGAKVVIIGRNEDKLRNISEKVRKTGNQYLVIKADISKNEDVKLIIEKTIEIFGKLNILVNNAAIIKQGSLLDGSMVAAFDEMMKTNLRGLIYLTMLATPHLIKSKGNVVNISSVITLKAACLDGFFPYQVTKAALDQFTKGAALELAPHGIRVNSVNPGPVNTDILLNSDIDLGKMSLVNIGNLTPMKRMSEPVEIAELILFLASDKAIGITGSIFVSDNGYLLK